LPYFEMRLPWQAAVIRSQCRLLQSYRLTPREGAMSLLPQPENRDAMCNLNRAEGRVALAVAAIDGATRVASIREEGSLRVRFPRVCVGAREAVLINTAGGIAGGDRFALALELGAGACLAVTTAAAEKVYRSLGSSPRLRPEETARGARRLGAQARHEPRSEPADQAESLSRISVSATVADGAALLWLPQETILFDRAKLARTVDIALAPGATLLFAETLVFGRTAMGETMTEGRIIDRWRVRRGERLIFAENFGLDGRIAEQLRNTVIAGGHAAIGTVLLAPGDDTAVASVRAVTEKFRGEVGISAWEASDRGGVAVARLVAPDGVALRHDLVAVLAALGHHALPRLWLT
jgi:urease accessory protein